MQHNKNLTDLAQELRRNMTKEEKQLWYRYLREYPVQFRRQVTCGNYIMDFYCAKAKLAIELDGSQHYEPRETEKDLIRTQFLAEQGIEVLRIPNNEVWKNLAGVCDWIDMTVKRRLQKTFPKGEGCCLVEHKIRTLVFQDNYAIIYIYF